METGKIRTSYVLIAAGIIFCIYGFTLLDALDYLHKPINPSDVAMVMAKKTETLLNLNIGLFVILSLIAGIWYWRSNKAIMFYVTAVYITLAVAGYFYVEEALFVFKKRHGLWEGGFSTTVIAAPIVILLNNLVLLTYYLILKAVRRR